MKEAAELIAIDVYKAAETTGQRITLAMVEQRLSDLLGHEPACANCAKPR